jgi:hypothetical protein
LLAIRVSIFGLNEDVKFSDCRSAKLQQLRRAKVGEDYAIETETEKNAERDGKKCMSNHFYY